MLLFKKTPFSFEEKDYEIQVLYNDKLVNVVAFHGNHPANGFRHQIRVSKLSSMQELLEQDVVDELIEMSKLDIIEKRWERLSGKSN